MNILTIVLLGCLVIYELYLFVRNVKVFEFTMELNHKGYEICRNYLESVRLEYDSEREENLEVLKETWESINNIPYTRYLFSFKKLTPENFLTEKQINFLRINSF